MTSGPVPTEVAKQRKYYATTARGYESKHVSEDDEHALALSLLAGLAKRMDHASFLDIGAGTGRGVRALGRAFPGARVVGIEPVAELREVGLSAGGISPDSLVEGDATNLDYPDDSFDWVVETGVLHHIRHFKAAVREMVRVARVGVLISDANNMGQGSAPARTLKQCLKRAGLWNAFIWLQTGGRFYKESDGDGVYFSFCAFDAVPILRQKFDHIHFMNTGSSNGDLYGTAGHVAIIAFNSRPPCGSGASL